MSDGYTKGPWLALDYTDTDEPAWHVVPHDYHGTIATLDPEQSANARLIAAAPNLLEALEGVLASLAEYRMRVKRIPFNVAVEANNAEIAARAAIAKARGADFAPRSDNLGQNDA